MNAPESTTESLPGSPFSKIGEFGEAIHKSGIALQLDPGLSLAHISAFFAHEDHPSSHRLEILEKGLLLIPNDIRLRAQRTCFLAECGAFGAESVPG